MVIKPTRVGQEAKTNSTILYTGNVMKKKYITAFLVLSFLLLLSSCASQQDVQALNYHVRSINKKLDDMKVNTVDQMQQRQAMSSGQLDQLQVDILKLKSKLEENNHKNRMLEEQNKELQLAVERLASQLEGKLNLKLSELDSKIASQKETLTALQLARIQDAERRSRAAKLAADAAMQKAQQAALARNSGAKSIVHIKAISKKVLFQQGTRSNIKVNPIATTPKSSDSTKPSRSTPPAQTAVVEQVDNYASGMQSYRDADYRKAYKYFQKSISDKGSRSSVITSRYMMGESLFKLGQYDQAIIEYQQIISNFPGNPQAAKALLRQGEAFEQLSDKETAKIIYKKLIASYGSSPEAATAKKKISSL